MTKNAADIAADMISAMKVADPELDTSIGTVARKILDVAAEQIAPAYAISFLEEWIYDIDTKEGASLDDYVNQFGIFRIPARRATGRVTFFRPKATTVTIDVPVSTYVSAPGNVTFTTVAAARILKGSNSVTVPVQATATGSSGNLPVGSIINMVGGLSGVSASVVQADATTGGLDNESDVSLRERFRKTVFRNLAGTEDMFLSLALEDPTPADSSDAQAVQAVVIGPTRQWREQIQVLADGPSLLGTSTIPLSNSKYIYEGSSFFGPDIDSGSILTEDVHYFFEADNPPVVRSIFENLVEDAVYELQFEYVSTASRNDPNNGITNRVDIWVSGTHPEAASEVTYWQPQTFVTDASNALHAPRYVRKTRNVGYSTAVSGNKFIQLAWGPIVEFPEILTINGEEYVRDTDFWVVHEDSAFGWSPRSRFGLEFDSGNVPPFNAQISLAGSSGSGYFFNRLPWDVEARARKWKLVTSDLMVHQARPFHVLFNFAVMYAPNYERGVVQSGIDAALSTWMVSQGFQSVIQVSDILSVAHNVNGVDNIRFLVDGERALEDDADSWGIQVVNEAGIHIDHLGSTRPEDRVLEDSQIPVLYDVRYVTKAQNSFGE